MAAAITLASLGGTFVSGGQRGRKGCFIPMNEDERDEEYFLNHNDSLRPERLSFDELAGWNTPRPERYDEDDRDLADRMLDTELSPKQINAAAQVMLDDPQLLIGLYRQATETDDELPDHSELVEEKIIGFVRSVFIAMLVLAPAKKINQSLMLRRDAETEKTLLSCMAQFARKELKQKSRYCVALPIMRTLGHNDVFASYLG